MNDNAMRLNVTDAMRQLNDDVHLGTLFAQIERLDLLLQQRLHALREREHDRLDMQSLLLDPDELEALDLEPRGVPRWMLDARDDPAHHPAAGIPADSRLGQLIERFGLTLFEIDALLLALLPQLDARYGSVFAYLQDNTERTQPTVACLLSLLCQSAFERLQQEACLASHASLRYHGLVNVSVPRRGQPGELIVPQALYRYLIGQDVLPEPLECCARWLAPVPGLPDRHPAFTMQLAQLCCATDAHPLPVIVLRGLPGSGRAQAVATALDGETHCALCVDLARLPNDDADAADALIVALRESRLHHACLVLREVSAFADKRPSLFALLQRRLAGHDTAVVCVVDPHAAPVWLGERPHVQLAMPVPSEQDKLALVVSQLDPYWDISTLDLPGLVQRFQANPDTLRQTLQEAELYRQRRDPGTPLETADLHAAFRARSQQDFGRLAQRVEPVRTFDDLVVGDALLQQLREILAAIRHRETLLRQGFARKIGYGFGISALFHGDSGTGKTMVAEVLAGELGVDLIKVDLSTVVNKYIGETEKNLSRIFDLAEADAGVLFFDEADALFGKRSETKDARDRHANIEVSYLLQRLENYPGLVVLATNHRSHLDEAFTRRITFMTRFAMPDAKLRERMWRQIWPAQVQLADDVDFAALARQTELSGANIRNVALLAGWLAAEDETRVQRAHIERALARELSKMGRTPM